MANLSTAQRNKMPASQFGGPDRSYPMPDASHAAVAKGRATQMVKKGKLSPSGKAKIDAKANKMLGPKARAKTGRGRAAKGFMAAY